MCFCFLFTTNAIYGQHIDSLQVTTLTERIQPAPENVFNKFREAGMKPVNHILTETEKVKISKAFSILPPLHQKVLKEHLYSISFMENMPNTALTSSLQTFASTKMFNITFRAEILNQTISEWATWKENTFYIKPQNNEYDISIDAGCLDAIVYVLLHESTHVVDDVLYITPRSEESNLLLPPSPFTADIWWKFNEPQKNATNAILETTRFRSGKTLAISFAPEIYKALQETPFATLYSMASCYEDLAEITTIYHLTAKMNQPYRILVKKNGITVSTYEPFNNLQVLKRLSQLEMFYS